MGDCANSSAVCTQRIPAAAVKEGHAEEHCSIRCVDLKKIPLSRRQHRKTLVFDRPLEVKPEVRLNSTAPRLAPTHHQGPPISILGYTPADVPPRTVHFTPPTAHHASSLATLSSPSLVSDEVISGIESALLSALLQSLFASLARITVFLFYGATLGLTLSIILVSVSRIV